MALLRQTIDTLNNSGPVLRSLTTSQLRTMRDRLHKDLGAKYTALARSRAIQKARLLALATRASK